MGLPKAKKLLMLCLALLIAFAATVWLYEGLSARKAVSGTSSSSDWCKQQEDCIYEAALRYQMQNSEGHEPSSLFFLSMEQARDPGGDLLKHLANNAFRVKPVSDSLDQRTLIKNKDTGESGVILRVGKITWVDKDRVHVGLSAYSGLGDVKAYIYHLTRGEKGWIVTKREFELES